MTLFTGLLTTASFSLFTISPVLLAIIAVIAIVLAILFMAVRPEIVYVDPDGDYEIYHEKHTFMKKVQLHGATKNGKKLVGWSTKVDGSKLVTSTSLVLFGTVTLYAVWETVAEDGAVRVEVNYMHSEEEQVIAKDIFVLNTKLPEEQDASLTVKGWGFDEKGAVVVSKKDTGATFVIKLYPVFAEDAVDYAKNKTNDKAVFDLVYGVAGKNVYKESHYVGLTLPREYEEYDNFIGWGFNPEGDLILDKTGADSIFTIELKAIGAVINEEEVKAPAIEEAPVEEAPVEEAPVAEVVAEEEPVEEAPVAEVVAEEPAEEAAEEAPVEEEVAEEIVEEPITEEAPAEEAVEEAPVEEPAPVEEVAEAVEEPVVYEEVAPTVVPTYIDNEGNKIEIKYSRSFIANVIQSEDAVKDYYSELKNHILSYKGVKSKISWKFDSYNKGRDQLFKMKLRGKTICLYCALDPNEFDKSKYHHDAIDAKIFAEVPMLVKIKSGLGLRKAKELVDIVMAKFGIEKNAKAKTVDYVNMYPYEETEVLLAKKLVKALVSDDANVKVSQKPVFEEAPVEEPIVEEVAEEPVVEEAVEEPAIEEAPAIEEVEEAPAVEETEEPAIEEAEEAADEGEVVYVTLNSNPLNIRYSRSVQANIIQSDDTVKSYYSELKNHILSYKGVKSRFSWKLESFNRGRVHIAKFKVRGKTLTMYIALDPNEFENSKYRFDVADSKSLASVPMAVKVKSALGLKKAKELVDILMAKLEIVVNPKAQAVDYVAANPYEENEPLINRGLIKVFEVNENEAADDEAVEEAPSVEEAPAIEEAVEEPAVEEAAEEPVVEETVEEPVVEEAAEEPAVEETVEEPVVEEAVEEPVVEEATEEPAVEETVEEPVVEEAVEEEPALEEHEVVVEEVSVYEADAIVEEKHIDVHTEEGVEYVGAKDNKKAIVNLDVLSDNFEAHETVDLASLKAKGLIDKKAKSLKILARGTINKPLVVKAGDFSDTAVKMIVLTGGNAVKVKYKVK